MHKLRGHAEPRTQNGNLMTKLEQRAAPKHDDDDAKPLPYCVFEGKSSAASAVTGDSSSVGVEAADDDQCEPPKAEENHAKCTVKAECSFSSF